MPLPRHRTAAAAGLCLALLGVASCGSSDPNVAGKNETAVTKQEILRIGGKWPLKPTAGFVYCNKGGYIEEGFRPKGSKTIYALNSWAEANNRGKYESINDIMQDEYKYDYRSALKGLQHRADDICGVPKDLRTS